MNKLEFYGDIIEEFMINSNVFFLSGWPCTGKITVGNILVQKSIFYEGKEYMKYTGNEGIGDTECLE